MGKVIYIISAGHSGSTLLDLAVGQITNIFSAGEIVYLPWQLLRGSNESDPQSYCSCGKDFINCELWQQIIHNIEKKHNKRIYENPKDFNLSIHSSLRYGKSLRAKMLQKLTYLSSKTIFFSFFLNFLQFFFKRSIKKNWLLFDEICATTGSKYVVDSSKNILRFLLLKKSRPEDIKLIVLIRGIQGVASSSHRDLSQDIILSRAKKWIKYYNNYVYNMLKFIDRHNFKIINYEDFCENPIEKLNLIANFLNIKEELKSIHINTTNYHLVAGNPLRLTGHVEINNDQRWKNRLSKKTIHELNDIQKKINKLLYKYHENILLLLSLFTINNILQF